MGSRCAAFDSRWAAFVLSSSGRRTAFVLPSGDIWEAIVQPFVRYGGWLWAVCVLQLAAVRMDSHGIARITAWNCTDNRMELHG